MSGRAGDRPLDERGLPEGYPLQAGLEITPRETAAGMARGLVVIDVREPAELAAASVARVGVVHIPLGDLPSRIGEIDVEPDEPIAVLCHHGGRSLKATLWLRQQGFAGARSVAGGIDVWSRAVDTSVPRY